MVSVMENPNLKWMMTGDTPILGKPQMYVLHFGQNVEAVAA